ncbi:UNVERIFIED_CONTAM: sulfur carrier protein ThiS [Halobacillus marinus]|uniref:sulfur carrier protein ThiS n=1 Tax=Bacillaceae TaxID=186817 RepID=UPI0002A4FAD2|nr:MULTISPECIES: sulfur carrier protein ThiS [Bacillaceae]ELK44928.1 sulfur carrier protein ThiS [Halobacillus sp. BAB-2008]QHT47042.1 sulfur carrier protein ThiS [Bacillus sp. SB49]
MNIHVNGKVVECRGEDSTVADLLEQLDIRTRFSVVELNRKILNKEEYDKERLQSGDSVEIVHFVGGG